MDEQPGCGSPFLGIEKLAEPTSALADSGTTRRNHGLENAAARILRRLDQRGGRGQVHEETQGVVGQVHERSGDGGKRKVRGCVESCRRCRLGQEE